MASSRHKFGFGGYGGPTWTSNGPIDEMESIVKYFHKMVPEVPAQDIKFLLQKGQHSELAAKSIATVILKLKLEFGTELSQMHAEIEEARRKAENDRRLQLAREHTQERHRRNKLVAARKNAEMFSKQIHELQLFMDKNFVGGKSDVPNELKQAYVIAEASNAIHRLFGLGRPYLVVKEVNNPYRGQIESLDRGMWDE